MNDLQVVIDYIQSQDPIIIAILLSGIAIIVFNTIRNKTKRPKELGAMTTAVLDDIAAKPCQWTLCFGSNSGLAFYERKKEDSEDRLMVYQNGRLCANSYDNPLTISKYDRSQLKLSFEWLKNHKAIKVLS